MMQKRVRVWSWIGALGFLLSAGAGAQSIAVPKELPNLGRLKVELEQYHNCTGTHGCYARDLQRETALAAADLRKAVRQSPPGAKLALVLDIDETSLSNYQQMQQADFGFVPSEWDRWVDEAAAPAIPGTLRLYREAERLGVAVFFVTGRPDSQRAATERDLRTHGYTRWAGLTMRSRDQLDMPTIAYKSEARARIVRAGYRIAVNVGDQMSDLLGKPQAEYSVKLSDPFYFIP
jgi:predicted secreted acid phosphatase